MRRAPNAWDRFYRYHEAPWRGERPLDMAPWLRGRILELGCGNGKLLRPLQRAGHDVVGLDISLNVLARLGQGVLADAARLPFTDGSFGTVLDIHCSGHLLDAGRAAAVAEARRVLAPDGHLVMERLGRGDLRAGQGAAMEPDTRAVQDGRTTHFSDEASLRRELADWTILEVTPTRRTMRLPNGPVPRESWRVVARAD